MGRVPYFNDSESDIASASSLEATKQKMISTSILKNSTANYKKKKCKLHRKVINSESEESDLYRIKSSISRIWTKLQGFLTHSKGSDNEKQIEKNFSSEDDEPVQPVEVPLSVNRCLVGRVPRPEGGRGGGVAIIVKRTADIKSHQILKPEPSRLSTTNGKLMKSMMRRLTRKRSF